MRYMLVHPVTEEATFAGDLPVVATTKYSEDGVVSATVTLMAIITIRIAVGNHKLELPPKNEKSLNCGYGRAIAYFNISVVFCLRKIEKPSLLYKLDRIADDVRFTFN